MELDHPDLMVFTPTISLSKSAVTAPIVWIILDVYQSMKLNMTYRHPYDIYNKETEYVLGWQVAVSIYNQ